MSKMMQGKCMCGAVAFSVSVPNMEVGVCHCSMCRKMSGGVFMAVGYEGDIECSDPASLAFYTSSDWGERGFCKQCGSTLFWRTRDKAHGVVSIQALDDPENPILNSEIFIDEKPDFYGFCQETKTMTGAEVFAAFAPKDEA